MVLRPKRKIKATKDESKLDDDELERLQKQLAEVRAERNKLLKKEEENDEDDEDIDEEEEKEETKKIDPENVLMNHEYRLQAIESTLFKLRNI